MARLVERSWCTTWLIHHESMGPGVTEETVVRCGGTLVSEPQRSYLTASGGLCVQHGGFDRMEHHEMTIIVDPYIICRPS